MAESVPAWAQELLERQRQQDERMQEHEQLLRQLGATVSPSQPAPSRTPDVPSRPPDAPNATADPPAASASSSVEPTPPPPPPPPPPEGQSGAAAGAEAGELAEARSTIQELRARLQEAERQVATQQRQLDEADEALQRAATEASVGAALRSRLQEAPGGSEVVVAAEAAAAAAAAQQQLSAADADAERLRALSSAAALTPLPERIRVQWRPAAALELTEPHQQTLLFALTVADGGLAARDEARRHALCRAVTARADLPPDAATVAGAAPTSRQLSTVYLRTADGSASQLVDMALMEMVEEKVDGVEAASVFVPAAFADHAAVFESAFEAKVQRCGGRSAVMQELLASVADPDGSGKLAALAEVADALRQQLHDQYPFHSPLQLLLLSLYAWDGQQLDGLVRPARAGVGPRSTAVHASVAAAHNTALQLSASGDAAGAATALEPWVATTAALMVAADVEPLADAWRRRGLAPSRLHCGYGRVCGDEIELCRRQRFLCSAGPVLLTQDRQQAAAMAGSEERRDGPAGEFRTRQHFVSAHGDEVGRALWTAATDAGWRAGVEMEVDGLVQGVLLPGAEVLQTPFSCWRLSAAPGDDPGLRIAASSPVCLGQATLRSVLSQAARDTALADDELRQALADRRRNRDALQAAADEAEAAAFAARLAAADACFDLKDHALLRAAEEKHAADLKVVQAELESRAAEVLRLRAERRDAAAEGQRQPGGDGAASEHGEAEQADAGADAEGPAADGAAAPFTVPLRGRCQASDLGPPFRATVAEARRRALATANCAAFCFEATDPDPRGPVVVHLKGSLAGLADGLATCITFARCNGASMAADTAGLQLQPSRTAGPLRAAAAPAPHRRWVVASSPGAVSAPPQWCPDDAGGGADAAAAEGELCGPAASLQALGLCPLLRWRLVRFYEEHNPAKLPSVAATLLAFRGRETDMFEQLVARYGPEPEGPDPPTPPGWRLAETRQGQLFWVHRSGCSQWRRPSGQ